MQKIFGFRSLVGAQARGQQTAPYPLGQTSPKLAQSCTIMACNVRLEGIGQALRPAAKHIS
jgi:hypothetical protein